MTRRLLPLLLMLSFFVSCKTAKNILPTYESENLKIEQLSPHTFVHISYLETNDYGKVACNGMLVIDNGEAIVFDTPTNDAVSNELIQWVENVAKATVKKVVVTHFHVDCLGGLQAFHDKGIPSYANQLTINLAKENKVSTLPNNGFTTSTALKVGNENVMNEHLGEGHTRDNIICYFPKDKVMFGGCLIKAQGAGKGNLADANVQEWSNTVEKIKLKYKDAEFIIPGHGKIGGKELLDYTITKFKK